MTLVYKTQELLMPPFSLTVPAEAVRGVKFAGQWFIFVSDPEVMAVSKYRLTDETVKLATKSIVSNLDVDALSCRTGGFGQIKMLSAEHGEDLTAWLMKQKFVKVQLVEYNGPPSMFGKYPTSGPTPNLDLKGPHFEG